MSLLDKVKGATGLGLTADEAYHRAYEKGVLLGDYSAASGMFEKAAEKFEQSDQSEQAHWARANQFLYAFAVKKDQLIIEEILPHLRALQEIEEFGSETRRVSAAELAAELEARKFENAAFASSDKPQEALHFHGKAAEVFERILRAQLKTYKIVPAAGHNDSAEERFFLHRGYTAFYQAVLVQDADPTAAADRLNEAALAFKRAQDEALRAKMAEIINNLRVKRTCWFCHREMQGMGLNVNYYRAAITRYGTGLLTELGQDATAADHARQLIAVCLPCATMIQNQADDFARARTEALRTEIEARLNQMISAINALSNRIRSLELRRH